MKILSIYLGKFLCWLGVHDFRVIDRSFQFGTGDGIEKVECKRCGIVVNRQY